MSHGKPNLDLVLKQIRNNIKNLEYGLILDNMNNTKFFLLAAVYDKPARAAVIKMVSSNGFFSCLRCEQEGETYFTDGEFTLILLF